MTYQEKLRDPRWQKKRLEILERDGWKCVECDDADTTLHVHHKNYIPDKEPWDIPNKLLITLCAPCHEYEKRVLTEALGLLRSAVKDNFMGTAIWALADGFHEIEMPHNPRVTANLINWVLKNKTLMKQLLEMYSKSSKRGRKIVQGEYEYFNRG